MGSPTWTCTSTTFIDEKRTVEKIVRESLEPPFEALSSLVRLIDIGLVEVFPQGLKEKRITQCQEYIPDQDQESRPLCNAGTVHHPAC